MQTNVPLYCNVNCVYIALIIVILTCEYDYCTLQTLKNEPCKAGPSDTRK